MHKKITWITLVSAIAFVHLMVRDTHAQIEIRQPPSGFGWREGVPLKLITNSTAVQKELGLSPKAVEKIVELRAQIAKESNSEFEMLIKDVELKAGKGSLLSAQEKKDLEKKAERIVKDRNMNRVNELLDSKQQARLHQIHLQAAGMEALSDPEVQKELKLSFYQRNQIDDTYRKSHVVLIDHLKQGLEPRDFDIKFDKMLLDVLSDTQKKAFEDLKGEPFNRLQSLRN